MACNDICIAFMHRTSRRVGCECMVGVDIVLVFDVCCEDMVNRQCVWCSMVSSVKWDNVQIEAYSCMA